MRRELRYKLTGNGLRGATGVGETVNLCSGAVAFTGEHEMKPGSFLEISISWPVLLHNSCPMRFIVYGRVIRSEGLMSVCSIDKYEFRTQARTPVLTMAAGRSEPVTRSWGDGIRKAARAGA